MGKGRRGEEGRISDLRRSGERECKYVESWLKRRQERRTWVNGNYSNLGVIGNWVDVLDGQGFMSDIALLLLEVHINFDIWRSGDRDRRSRGVWRRGRMVMLGIPIYRCRYTIDAVVNGKKGPLLIVDGVVGAVEESVTRSLAHDFRDGHGVTRRDKKIFGELGGSDGALVFIVCED